MKSFYSPNTLLLIAALPLALIPMASGAGLEIDKDGDAHLTTDNGQTLDLKTLFTLPLKLLSLASESGLEINSSEQGEVIVDSNKALDIQASGKDVAVTGNGNTIHIHGDLPRLTLIGRDNVVELDRVGTVALLGPQNQVRYLSGLDSDGPTDCFITQLSDSICHRQTQIYQSQLGGGKSLFRLNRVEHRARATPKLFAHIVERLSIFCNRLHLGRDIFG
jgi:Protein of unknown function (DUF3060)